MLVIEIYFFTKKRSLFFLYTRLPHYTNDVSHILLNNNCCEVCEWSLKKVFALMPYTSICLSIFSNVEIFISSQKTFHKDFRIYISSCCCWFGFSFLILDFQPSFHQLEHFEHLHLFNKQQSPTLRVHAEEHFTILRFYIFSSLSIQVP